MKTEHMVPLAKDLVPDDHKSVKSRLNKQVHSVLTSRPKSEMTGTERRERKKQYLELM